DVATLDRQPFLTVNGVQTLSQTVATVADQIEALRDAGVAALRLSPHIGPFTAIAEAYCEALAGVPGLGLRLRALMADARFSDGFVDGRPGASPALTGA